MLALLSPSMIPHASVVTTLVDLGVPTVIGAMIGAYLTHVAAKARGREEHQRTLELLVFQDERRAAQAALDAVRDMRNRINAGEVADKLGSFHNEWADRVLAPTRQIRSDDLNRRVSAFGTVIFLSMLARDEYTSYALLRGALDIEEWLEPWLRREEPLPPHLPPSDEIRAMTREGNRFTFDALDKHLERKASPGPVRSR